MPQIVISTVLEPGKTHADNHAGDDKQHQAVSHNVLGFKPCNGKNR